MSKTQAIAALRFMYQRDPSPQADSAWAERVIEKYPERLSKYKDVLPSITETEWKRIDGRLPPW